MSFSSLKERYGALPVTVVATAVAVFLSVIGCITLADRLNGITPIWLANAILLAVLLNMPTRSWFALVACSYIGNFCAYMVLGNATSHALILSFANSAEVLLVAAPMRHMKLDRRLTRPAAIALLCALSFGPAVSFSASIGAAYVTLAYGANFQETFFTWYFADVLSLIIATPVLAAFRFRELGNLFRSEKAHIHLALFGMVAFTLVAIFFVAHLPMLFFIFPPILIVIFRFGFAGGALALGMATICSIMATANGFGPFTQIADSFQEQLIYVQIFLAVLNFTILQTAASLATRRKVELKLLRLSKAHERAKHRAETARSFAEEANRAKSTFLASMCHELRTPLNAIIGFSEIMKTETFGPIGKPIYAEYAADIHMSGQHLLSLVNDVLELSRIASGKVELENSGFDLHEILHEGMAILTTQASSFGVMVEHQLGSEPMFINADRRHILQIFINLLSNAVKFTPAGGKVRVWCERDVMGTRFGVTDEGIGIVESDIPKVLSYFGQANGWTARRNQGHGLGLPISEQLTELHGGNLDISSALKRGTTVMITLPGSRTAAAPAEARRAPERMSQVA